MIMTVLAQEMGLYCLDAHTVCSRGKISPSPQGVYFKEAFHPTIRFVIIFVCLLFLIQSWLYNDCKFFMLVFGAKVGFFFSMLLFPISFLNENNLLREQYQYVKGYCTVLL